MVVVGFMDCGIGDGWEVGDVSEVWLYMESWRLRLCTLVTCPSL